MDPITSAIVVALGKLAEPVVRDSYEAVKKLVARKLGADNPVSDSIQHLERRPDSATRQADVGGSYRFVHALVQDLLADEATSQHGPSAR